MRHILAFATAVLWVVYTEVVTVHVPGLPWPLPNEIPSTCKLPHYSVRVCTAGLCVWSRWFVYVPVCIHYVPPKKLVPLENLSLV